MPPLYFDLIKWKASLRAHCNESELSNVRFSERHNVKVAQSTDRPLGPQPRLGS